MHGHLAQVSQDLTYSYPSLEDKATSALSHQGKATTLMVELFIDFQHHKTYYENLTPPLPLDVLTHWLHINLIFT